MTLTLSDALKDRRLEDFIKQQEAAGIGPADEAEVLAAIDTVAKSLTPEDQTSRSPSGDGSSGKKTR